MPKSKRPNPNPNPNPRGRGKWSNMPNPYQIPATLNEAIGSRGEPQSMVNAYWNVNPAYNPQYNEFTKNCQRCVFAYELNRRGYDVEALPTFKGDTMGYNVNWTKALNGMKADNVGARSVDKVISNIRDKMSQYGDGSRAIVSVDWRGSNSGHVFNIEYRDGTLYAYDPQNNRKTTNTNLLKLYLSEAVLSRTEIYRTDDKSISDNMRYMVKKRG